MTEKVVKLAGVVLALSALLLLLVAGGLIHQHRSAAEAAACVICHVANAPLAPVAPAVIVPSTVIVAPAPQARKELPRKEIVHLQSPSRAPPA
ncbi:MAG TPA: hypothetical protein VNJ52_03360 [Patescibacteria group bacterium]|nr:hypothetical protein [Patescibacteria group bacterium]